MWLPLTRLYLWPREVSWTGGGRGGPGLMRERGSEEVRKGGREGLNRIGLGELGGGGGEARSLAILLLSWQPAASIDFSPFTEISTRPSFAEAYRGLEDSPFVGFCCSMVAGCGTNTLRIHTAIIFRAKCKHLGARQSPRSSPRALLSRLLGVHRSRMEGGGGGMDWRGREGAREGAREEGGLRCNVHAPPKILLVGLFWVSRLNPWPPPSSIPVFGCSIAPQRKTALRIHSKKASRKPQYIGTPHSRHTRRKDHLRNRVSNVFVLFPSHSSEDIVFRVFD